MSVVSFLNKSSRPRDWSQQELATFYRVQNALVQAGLSVSCDRGMTDEGDPWFVFCREDGEIALHFARIEGSYFVAGPTLKAAASSKDFDQLVRELLDRHASIRPSSGNNVFMHPAALLVMLVAMAVFNGPEANAHSEFEDKSGRSRAAGDGGGGLSGAHTSTAAASPAVKEAAQAALILSAITLLSDVVVEETGRPHSPGVDEADGTGTQAVRHAGHEDVAVLLPDASNPSSPHVESALHSAPAEAVLASAKTPEHLDMQPALVPQATDRGGEDAFAKAPHDASVGPLTKDAGVHEPVLERPQQSASPAPVDHLQAAAEKAAPTPPVSAPPSSSPEALKAAQLDFGGEKALLAHVDPSFTLSDGLKPVLEQGPHFLADGGAASSGHNTSSVQPPADPAAQAPPKADIAGDIAPKPEAHRPAMQEAIDTFTAQTSEYRIVLSGPDVLFVDKFAVEHSPQLVVNVTFDFADGSHLSLIGLPANLPEGLA
jgi:hypothetical protein